MKGFTWCYTKSLQSYKIVGFLLWTESRTELHSSLTGGWKLTRVLNVLKLCWWVQGAASAIRGQRPFMVLGLYWLMRVGNPCRGQGGSTGCQRPAPPWGSRRLHWLLWASNLGWAVWAVGWHEVGVRKGRGSGDLEYPAKQFHRNSSTASVTTVSNRPGSDMWQGELIHKF